MSSKELLKGKNILITSFSFASFGGAELNSVELAEQLREFGAIPHFFSYDIDGPLMSYINKKFNTEVLTDSAYYLAETQDELGNTKLDIDDYDYVWIGGNTIPISIIQQINSAKTLPKFIFIHMSPLIAFPLDAPLLGDFEKDIATRILSIGDGTTVDSIYRILGKDVPLGEWKNPAPSAYRSLAQRGGELKRIAVISSSYPSDEIMNIKSEIQGKNIDIEYIGKYADNLQVVDKDFYNRYDLIIGIGKNVKYSLVSGIPIYIYGRFGGPGYLNNSNYKLNDEFNFSGRGFSRRSSAQIANEVISGYKDALRFHEAGRDRFIQDFSIDMVSERLFKELESEDSKSIVLSKERINWLVSMQINLMQRLQTAGSVRSLNSHIYDLEATKVGLTDELAAVYASKSWKFTKLLRAMSSRTKTVTRKIRGR